MSREIPTIVLAIRIAFFMLSAAGLLMPVRAAWALEIQVEDAGGLRAALLRACPGTVIKLANGNYGNGYFVEKLSGTRENRIVITGLDEKNPPLFTCGTEAFHFSDCNYVTLRNVKVSSCSANGINADDGGTFDTPSGGMAFEKIIVEDVGPQGNRDGLKLSGLADFTISGCSFSGWGGSAIDMVGCRDGVIDKCSFTGKEGFSQDSGIQAKGGSERILVRLSFFKNAGQRAVNLGGSTGLEFFRPKLVDFEARSVEIAGNRFVGSMAPVAFATSVGCIVRRNTFVNPGKWVMRILQEQPLDKFQPCQKGVFEGNLIVYDRRVQVFVNVGPDTRPESFVFRGNAWFCSDADRRPSLPVDESDGLYQVNPMLENAGGPDMKARSRDPRILKVGAQSYSK